MATGFTTGFTNSARRLGLFSSITAAVLILAYAITLVIGFLSLQSAGDPIGDPMFTILEVLIIALMPVLVSLFAAVHAWALDQYKVHTFVAVSFMTLLAVVTCGVHFMVLTLSRNAAFAGQPWAPLFFSFKWPSVVYALDILGWDIFSHCRCSLQRPLWLVAVWLTRSAP